MDIAECRHRFGAAEHAYLATVSPARTGRSVSPACTGHTGHTAGVPHLVPVTFDLTDDEIAVAIDHKPKRTTRLRRLTNIEANPQVTFLVDHYEPDWSALWWVRADARAVVIHDGERHREAIERLRRRYSQYRQHIPTGPVILASVTTWRGWAARGA